MTVPQKQKNSKRTAGFWLPALACLLLAGTVWLGFQQYEAQQRNNNLFLALQAADPVAVRVALDSGANPNSVIAAGSASGGFYSTLQQWFDQIMHRNLTSTTLTVAVSSQNPQCVRLLLDKGADPNRPNSDGGTPLTRATSIPNLSTPQDTQALTRKQIQIMQMLLDKGANINAQDQDGRTALSNSATNGFCRTANLSVSRFLLAHGAKPDSNATPSEATTPLQQAVQDVHNKTSASLVTLLLNYGADANKNSSANPLTPLQIASQGTNTATVQALLKHGADPNCGNLPLNPNSDSLPPPLLNAAQTDQVGIICLLLAAGANANVHAHTERPLRTAITHQRADIVKLLLEHGADPKLNSPGDFRSALVAAISDNLAHANNNAQIVRLLLVHGADPNLLGLQDEVPLTAAADTCLLEGYYDRHKSPGDAGHLPNLLPVSPPCSTQITLMLLAAGANVNKANYYGNTALAYAVAGHNVSLVRLLMAYGANPKAQGVNRYEPKRAEETPLGLATERGYSDLLPLLRQTQRAPQNPQSAQ